MKIGFIGAGKVGVTLGKFFQTNELQVIGFYDKNRASAEEAAVFCGAKTCDSIEELVLECDSVFLTVPDEIISSVYHELIKLDIRGKELIHCSGAMTANEAFPDIFKASARGCSMHPLYPISDRFASYKELCGAYFCLEGDADMLAKWSKLLKSFGLNVKEISEDVKVRYHAACAVSSNFACALVQESIDLLLSCGFSESEALCAISPLISGNMEHIIKDGPIQALTGPLERGDTQTLAKHIACLDSDYERELYRLLSVKLLEAAHRKHPDRDYKAVEKLLKGDEQA